MVRKKIRSRRLASRKFTSYGQGYAIPTTFANPFPSGHSDPKLKKRTGHRMTGRELVEKEEALKRRENERLSTEKARREKYHELHQNDIESKYITDTLSRVN